MTIKWLIKERARRYARQQQFKKMAVNVQISISRWHLVERNVHINIKTKFDYKHWTPTQESRREKVNDDKEVNHSWTRIDRWLRHHMSRTTY